MVLRDRNHSSIVICNIGNEIDYPTDPFVHPRGRHDNSIPPDAGGNTRTLSADLMPAIARRLICAVNLFDVTRPVTMALDALDTSHGSNGGVVDGERFGKPAAYLRQALWSSKPMVYAAAGGAGSAETDAARMAQWPGNLGRTPLVERWGWTGDPRKNIPLEIYTNCDSVELLLNGRSLGEKPIADRLLR